MIVYVLKHNQYLLKYILNSPSGLLLIAYVKPCQSVVVKGLERNISCLYEARRQLLGLDSCVTAKETQMTLDPVLASSGPTSYWFNMLLQQLRLSEQGEHTHVCQFVCIQICVMGTGKSLCLKKLFPPTQSRNTNAMKTNKVSLFQIPDFYV